MLVFVHGESYEWNSGNPYDGSVLASYGGLLVVTINYRLGVLGTYFSASLATYNILEYGIGRTLFIINSVVVGFCKRTRATRKCIVARVNTDQ